MSMPLTKDVAVALVEVLTLSDAFLAWMEGQPKDASNYINNAELGIVFSERKIMLKFVDALVTQTFDNWYIIIQKCSEDLAIITPTKALLEDC
jgi:hypothetical protein